MLKNVKRKTMDQERNLSINEIKEPLAYYPYNEITLKYV